MGRIITSGTIKHWCPVCKHDTAGVIEESTRKTVCPLCKRELWQCQKCKDYTFGLITDADQCHHCGAVKDP